MSAVDCPYGDESLVVADYLAGRLPRAEARSFEAHSFGCDRCFGELQRATELRAAADAHRAGTATSRPAARTSRFAWPAVGLAAAVALAVGIWITQPTTDQQDGPVYRDAAPSGEILPVEVSRSGSSITLSWPPVDGADRYSVRVWSETGEPLLEQNATEPAVELAEAHWQDAAGANAVYVQVLAVDELQQVIVRSEFVPL